MSNQSRFDTIFRNMWGVEICSNVLKCYFHSFVSEVSAVLPLSPVEQGSTDQLVGFWVTAYIVHSMYAFIRRRLPLFHLFTCIPTIQRLNQRNSDGTGPLGPVSESNGSCFCIWKPAKCRGGGGERRNLDFHITLKFGIHLCKVAVKLCVQRNRKSQT